MKKKLNLNLKLLLPILVFLCLTMPFIKILPYMDGNIDFIQVLDFYSGGWKQYFANWNTVHPPLKLFIITPLFLIFGPSPLSYNLFGILFGSIGITSIFLLTKKIANEKAAFLTALFLSIYPLFISNSIFIMRDFMITSLILTSLYFYINKKYPLYSLFISLALLTKETAFILPIIIIFIEFFYLIIDKKNKINAYFFLKLFSLLSPIFIYYVWKIFLSTQGKKSWSEWIFTDNENKSAIFTIFNNLFTFNFFNPYAQAHIKQFIFLNFNWVYILIIICSFVFFSFKESNKIDIKSQESKTIFIVIIFVISYILSVLTLQTYTIPRYALPITPFILIGLGISLSKIKNNLLMKSAIIGVISIMVLSLFSSSDPIANYLWGKTKIFNQNIFAVNEHMAGNDGITYNLQYLLIAKQRSEIIQKSMNPNGINSKYCRWIFPDPNNEFKMISYLKLNLNLKCNQI